MVLEALALGDASASWCVMIANTSALSAAYLTPQLAQEIYGDPDIITAGVFAPMGKATDEGDHYSSPDNGSGEAAPPIRHGLPGLHDPERR